MTSERDLHSDLHQQQALFPSFFENRYPQDLFQNDNDRNSAIDEEPLYVNAKQYFRILKRRVARSRLEEVHRLSRQRKVRLFRFLLPVSHLLPAVSARVASQACHATSSRSRRALPHSGGDSSTEAVCARRIVQCGPRAGRRPHVSRPRSITHPIPASHCRPSPVHGLPSTPYANLNTSSSSKAVHVLNSSLVKRDHEPNSHHSQLTLSSRSDASRSPPSCPCKAPPFPLCSLPNVLCRLSPTKCKSRERRGNDSVWELGPNVFLIIHFKMNYPLFSCLYTAVLE